VSYLLFLGYSLSLGLERRRFYRVIRRDSIYVHWRDWVYSLASKLNERKNEKYEIINFAVSGYSLS
jgi:hypothetical protein